MKTPQPLSTGVQIAVGAIVVLGMIGGTLVLGCTGQGAPALGSRWRIVCAALRGSGLHAHFLPAPTLTETQKGFLSAKGLQRLYSRQIRLLQPASKLICQLLRCAGTRSPLGYAGGKVVAVVGEVLAVG